MKSIQCHYDILSIDQNADENAIKKSYRKLALKYHPDKNINCTNEEKEENNHQFRLLQAAYECLSDPVERKWYDEHREVILNGGMNDNSEDNKRTCSYIFDVIPYHHAGCYNGYDDTDKSSFYNIYSYVFLQIYTCEERGYHETILKYDKTKEAMPFTYVGFGTSKSDIKNVLDFYTQWENFSSCLNYKWEDIYDIREAENRRVRRAMEEENKKKRKLAKKVRNEDVISLVRFVKRRDPRIITYKEKQEMDKRRKEVERQKEKERLKREAAKAREDWIAEAEKLILERENDDMEAGRFRLDDDDFYKKSRRKGKKNKRIVYSSSEDEGDDDDEDSQVMDQVENLNTDTQEQNIDVNSNGSKDETYDINKDEILLNDILNIKLDTNNDDNDDNEMIEESEYESETEEDEIVVWKCIHCKKDFKSEGQLQNHEKSKKHKETVKKLSKRK